MARIIERSSGSGRLSAARFSEDAVARISHRILAIASYTRRRGVMHCGVEPENILFKTGDERSPVRVVGFGLGGTPLRSRQRAPSSVPHAASPLRSRRVALTRIL